MTINDVSVFFLVLSLVLPRITLLICWLSHCLPFNTTPFMGDVIGGILIPRVLILIWLWDINSGPSTWFWIHLAAFLVAYGFNFFNLYLKCNKD